VVERDGDGWADCHCGQRHWGRHGAAGLLLCHVVPSSAEVQEPQIEILLQFRAGWTHQGNCWGLPGGALDSHEDVVAGALRETWEEVGAGGDDVVVLGTRVGVAHPRWSYTYVLARTVHRLVAKPMTEESTEVRWLPLEDLAGLPLHPGLAEAWPELLPWIRASL
jgi:8-oxo-dGTP pyrophosphatase MutT (NUDIX family)